MQPHQLEYFLAVAETGSFTRGASRAGVVQSAVSAAVAQLERHLDATLFDRAYHRVTLTAEGEALVPRARDVLAAMGAARDAVAAVRGELTGTVVLGTMVYYGGLVLPRILQAFAQRHPKVSVHLRQTVAGSTSSLDGVRSGSLDLALVSSPTASAPGVDLIEIHRESMILICDRDHRLAGEATVSIEDLLDEEFIDFPSGYGNREATDRAFSARGHNRRIRTEVTDIDLSVSLVGHGLGIAVIPRHIDTGTTVVIELAEPIEWTASVALPTERRVSPAASELAEAIIASGWHDLGADDPAH